MRMFVLGAVALAFVCASAAGPVNAGAAEDAAALKATAESAPPASLLLFSPPVDFMPFDELRLPDTTCLITLGDRDEFCALASLEGWLAKQPRERVQRIVLKGGDHFYRGQETALKQAITEFVGANKHR